MANGKKGFILYADQQELFEMLSDEQAGKLVKHIFNYVNDQGPVTHEDNMVAIAFIPIKQTLKRDLKKREEERKKRSDAGKKGMQSRWGNKDNNDKSVITKDNSVIPAITNITDSVSVSVSVSDSVKENNSREKKSNAQKKKEGEFLRGLYPNKPGRTGNKKKAIAIYLDSAFEYTDYLAQINLLRREVKLGITEVQYLPNTESRFRNFKPLDEMIVKQQVKKMFLTVVESHNDKLKDFKADRPVELLKEIRKEYKASKDKALQHSIKHGN